MANRYRGGGRVAFTPTNLPQNKGATFVSHIGKGGIPLRSARKAVVYPIWIHLGMALLDALKCFACTALHLPRDCPDNIDHVDARRGLASLLSVHYLSAHQCSKLSRNIAFWGSRHGSVSRDAQHYNLSQRSRSPRRCSFCGMGGLGILEIMPVDKCHWSQPVLTLLPQMGGQKVSFQLNFKGFCITWGADVPVKPAYGVCKMTPLIARP